MKKYVFIILMSIACAHASAQKELFEKFEDAKNVESVYISKAMFELVGATKIGNMSVKNIPIGDKISKIDHLYILSSKDAKMATGLAEAFATYYKEGKFEELMRVKNDGQKTTIYMRQLKNKMNEIGLFSTGDGIAKIISLVGMLTIEDIKDVVGKK